MIEIPTRIYFAIKAMDLAKHDLASLGKRAMILTGKKSAKLSGALDDLIDILNQIKISSVLYDKVQENPSVELVFELSRLFREQDCDFIIGCGGGSPIDAAKAVVLVAANSISEEQVFDPTNYKSGYPIVAIPTTAGTGTEATQYSVLTHKKYNKKAGFGSSLAFPTISVIDPRYTVSMSSEVTLNTGIDALSHLLEGIYSNKRDPLLYNMIAKGIKLIYDKLPILLTNPGNLEARTAMMEAALCGGKVIANTSTTFQHSIGYPLTSCLNVPHGLANAIVMKQVMDLYYPVIHQELDDVFGSIGLSKEMLFSWLDHFGLKAKLDITDEFIESKIPEVMASRNMANNPIQISEETVRSVFKSLKQ